MVIGLSKDYLAALGEVIANWGFCETSLEWALDSLRLLPTAFALAPKPPAAFNRRVDLFRDSARLAFPGCPSLVARTDGIADRAKTYSRHRNRLVHGFWLSDGRVTVLARDSGRLQEYEVTIQDVAALAKDINALTMELVACFRVPTMKIQVWPLPSDEIAALQAFHKNNPRPAHGPTPKEARHQLRSFRA